MSDIFDKIGYIFTQRDNTYPEICICNLSETDVVDAYNYIRSITKTVGGAGLVDLASNHEVGIDDLGNAAQLVIDGKAYPFHFVCGKLSFDEYYIEELGVFILDNAVALDYQKGPIWDSKQIESLLRLIIKIMPEESYIQFEDDFNKDDSDKILQAIEELKSNI